jgi:hypothetical protein
MTPDTPSSDLNNQTITVTVNGPAGKQNFTATTSDTSGDWSLPLSLFSQKGSYFITASYVGTGKLLSATSAIATILVEKSVGYAIIVHGKINGNEGLLDHRHTTDMIRDKLKQRLFSDDNIKYLQSTPTTSPTKADVQNAITVWGRDKMNNSPAPLVVILVDHGDPGIFYLGNDTITPVDLAGWLTTLDNNLTPDAKTENQIIIIGSCYSGSFIPSLSRRGRITITSADATERSIRGTVVDFSNGDKIRQGEAFLEELFTRIGTGAYLGDAFKQAAAAITPKIPRITNGMHSDVWDDLSQHPLIDANGDGKGSFELDGTDDGKSVARLIAGDGAFNAAENPADIHAVTPTGFLQPAESSSLLWLTANQDSRVDSAWIEIRKPNTPIPTGGTGQIIIDLETIQLSHNTTLGRWEYLYPSFTTAGTYEIYYYTKDKQTGEISPLQRGLVYKNTVINNAPGVFDLESPDDATTQKTALVFRWKQSKDPDNDPLSYTLQISRDNSFTAIDYQRGEITDTWVVIGSESGLTDVTPYYWRVIAIDSYGGQHISTQTRSFSTNNTNGLPGFITGYVRDNASGVPLSGAEVSIGTNSVIATTLPNGGFISPLPTGTYSVTVSARGYLPRTVADVEITPGTVFDASMNLASGSPSTTTSTTAKIYLGNDDTFTVSSSGATLYGSAGTDTVTITSGTTGITLDQNIERINLPGAAASYLFKQTGNKINIYDTSGVTQIVTVPVQGDSDGTILSFSDGSAAAQLTSGIMTLGSATVSTTATALTPTLTATTPTTTTTTSAKVYLGNNDSFTISSSGTTLYGGSGIDTVTIAAGVTGVKLDQNVERINLPGSADSYTFKQTGNKINIYDTSGVTQIVNVPVQGDADGTILGFSDGAVSAMLTGGVMTVGGKTISQ